MTLPSSRVIGHKEWAPGRKSDPTYSMSWRRQRVAAFTPRGGTAAGSTPTPAPKPTTPVEDDMPTAEDVWNFDAGGADGKQRAKDLLSQVNTELTKPVARVDADAGGPAEGEIKPVSRAKMIDYIDARTRRLERDLAELQAGQAEILALLKGQQPTGQG